MLAACNIPTYTRQHCGRLVYDGLNLHSSHLLTLIHHTFYLHSHLFITPPTFTHYTFHLHSSHLSPSHTLITPHIHSTHLTPSLTHSSHLPPSFITPHTHSSHLPITPLTLTYSHTYPCSSHLSLISLTFTHHTSHLPLITHLTSLITPPTLTHHIFHLCSSSCTTLIPGTLIPSLLTQAPLQMERSLTPLETGVVRSSSASAKERSSKVSCCYGNQSKCFCSHSRNWVSGLIDNFSVSVGMLIEF